MHNRRWVGRNRGNNLKSIVNLTHFAAMSNVYVVAPPQKRVLTNEKLTLTLSPKVCPLSHSLGRAAFHRCLGLQFRRRWNAALPSLLLSILLLMSSASVSTGEHLDLGCLYDRFALTLAPGHRTEAAGPFFYNELKESTRLWAVPPLLSYTRDNEVDYEEFDFAYPIISYDRFGDEYRFQIFQLLSFAGGQTQSDTNVHRFTLFPIFFNQRSHIPEKNYTAVIPIYGTLKQRLFRDEVHFVLMPLYVKSRKRDIVTWNMPYPFFHIRRGDGLRGWQFWPITGVEHKEVTKRTNHWEEVETIPGHDKFFVLWPIYFNQMTGIGSDNPEKHRAVLPLFSILRSPKRDSWTAPWPLGLTHTVDREKKYEEWGAPWPLIVFARGEGKHMTRVWPLFNRASSTNLQSDWYLWPAYKYRRLDAPPLDRRRTRIFFFLYSDLVEENTETGAAKKRRDLWPLFTSRQELNGDTRLQLFAPLEPILPNNKSIERNYSPLWSVWRAEKNKKTGASSQSLLWSLYRRESSLEQKKLSLLFGLFRYHSDAEARRWRIFYVPVAKQTKQGSKEDSAREGSVPPLPD